MSYYREKLLQALRVLVDDGDLNMRLTHAAGCLFQIDDDDVPADAFAEFERIRDPLIQRPMISKGEMLPRVFLRDCQEIIAPENRCKALTFLAATSLSDSLIS